MEQLPRLPDTFFDDNPLDERSPAALTEFLLQAQTNQGLQAYLERAAEKKPPTDEAVLAEARRIAGLDTPQALVDYLRKCRAPDNETALRRRLLEQQAETMPLLLRRFKTSSQDTFIDNATLTLAQGEEGYLLELYRDYGEIRDAYAQSMALYLFGKRGLTQAAELLRREYERFGRDYPKQSYAQGPLLGLYILYGKA